jgi:hypothetical protein
MTPDTNLVAPAPEAQPQSFFGRLLGVYFSPGETFQAIGRRPDLILPIVLLMILGGTVGYVMINRVGVENFFRQSFEQAVASGRLTEEQAKTQLEQMSSGTASKLITVNFLVAGALGNLLIALGVAALFKLISMIMGIENDFKPLFSVTLYSFLAVSLISSVIVLILLYLKPVEEIDIQNLVGSNLAALIQLVGGRDALPKFLMGFARWIDLFFIWIFVLLAIGYAAVSRRLKTSTAAWIVGGMYLVAALIGATVFSFWG